MILPILCLAAAGLALYAIKRGKSRHDPCHERSYGDDIYLAREIRAALNPDLCDGTCCRGCRGATAAMDAPFPRGRDGGRGGFDHAGRG